MTFLSTLTPIAPKQIASSDTSCYIPSCFLLTPRSCLIFSLILLAFYLVALIMLAAIPRGRWHSTQEHSNDLLKSSTRASSGSCCGHNGSSGEEDEEQEEEEEMMGRRLCGFTFYI
mmetsp:Transcript_17427/g.28656  ORF Transcript_17427/g.28656 Transcript_17427/m.28656 type:complete len:116 (+) Transcript_17427:71-418(+)